jgi:hypothetical protein
MTYFETVAAELKRRIPIPHRKIDILGALSGNTNWGFEQHCTSSKTIKLSMIRLGNEDVREEVVIRPDFATQF